MFTAINDDYEIYAGNSGKIPKQDFILVTSSHIYFDTWLTS